jgi:hypothetical protein
MSSRHQNRLWAGGIGMAAATVAMIGMGTAHADTIDELLIQSEGDMTQTGSLYGGIDPSLLDAHQAAGQAMFVSDLQNQADLIAQIQTQQDALPEALQTSSQLLGVDQHLATASGDLVSAMNTFVNAADAGDFATGQTPTLIGDVTGYFAKLDFVYAEVFQVLPAELNAEFTTVFADFPESVDPVSAAATATDPGTLLSEATTNYADSNQLLAELSSSASAYAPAIATNIQFQDGALQDIANVGSAESALSSYDNGVLSDFLNPVFTSVDQGWDQASEAALNADQAVESAVATGSATDIASAFLGIAGPEYQAIGPGIQSDFIDLAAHFLTGGDFTSAADLAAGVDPVSALDPSIFADLLSSIGL